MAKTVDVFGIKTEPVLSYISRVAVDDKFKAAISSAHHIVVYGSSKQGKTSLRQTYVHESKCIVVRCSPTMSTEGIYSSVLRQAGISITTIQTESSEAGGKVHAKLGFKAVLPWIGGAKTEAGTELSKSTQSDLTREFVAFNFAEAQSIGELLAAVSFNKFIVLENFHYLSAETQRQLAFDLKTFHEISIRFIILGIWWEANHLMTYNNDLQDRIVEIPVEPWENRDFELVAKRGAELLNVTIAPAIIQRLIENSYGNVGMLQEFLKTFCIFYGVEETKEEVWQLNSDAHVTKTLEEKLRTQRGQLLKTLQGIAANSRVRSNEGDPLLLPYYLMLVICRTPVATLREGFEKYQLLDLLRAVHHRTDKETIRIGDVTNLITRIPTIQKDIQPPFLYWDSMNRRVRIVDTRQFFVLANINGQELADDIPYPREDLREDEDREKENLS